MRKQGARNFYPQISVGWSDYTETASQNSESCLLNKIEVIHILITHKSRGNTDASNKFLRTLSKPETSKW